MGDRSHCGKSVIDNPQLGLIVYLDGLSTTDLEMALVG
ncbi:hypothetical protein GXM_08414 [Nostoc sphaeroides CCNUC1]|uniref:Uncharacterized protein n=1 Tax=Nostoc sphaeroides CCNUC1 TaxID=2653204 RepID=A0A5P8WE81_9NOSO|nr:hypothetical protein GXM_08414 [Nostoc sphaeroides CCNUC1]